jgi:hypothetical protein
VHISLSRKHAGRVKATGPSTASVELLIATHIREDVNWASLSIPREFEKLYVDYEVVSSIN